MGEKQELQKPADQLVELGTWIGRGQAFGMLANKCSAAQAECLRKARQERSYERLGVNWEEFCEKYAGISRSYAHKLIKRLEEFGAAYFQISEIVPVSPETYRRIAASVRQEGIEIDGEVVPITQENAPRIRHLLESKRTEQPSGEEANRSPKRSIPEVRQRLDACIRDLGAIAEAAPDKRVQTELLALVGHSIDRLKQVSRLP